MLCRPPPQEVMRAGVARAGGVTLNVILDAHAGMVHSVDATPGLMTAVVLGATTVETDEMMDVAPI